MTTLERWWAPAGPGIGPDDVDLALLEPGPDGMKDLGQAFLALHRVGAAACEAVATQPLADEGVLISVLAQARSMVAPPAVTMVSKAVGDAPYAGLLLRDVLDDAESAALSLYRSCLASSVAPPFAAERVGMVYGVPASELGRFSKAATDPKTHPRALADLADRVLFSYVSKLVEQEGVPTKIIVAKAPGMQEQRPEQETATRLRGAMPRVTDYLDAHNVENDAATGQFVREGSQATSRARVQRVKRVKRVQRAAPVARAGVERAGVARGGVQRSQAERVKAVRAHAQRADAHHLDALPVIHKVTSRSRQQRGPGDVMAPLPDDDFAPYGAIGQKTSFVLPSDEFSAFRKAALQADGSRVFRAGHLEAYVGQKPVLYETEDATGVEESAEHDAQVNAVVAMLYKDDVFKHQKEPVFDLVENLELKGLSPDAAEERIEEMKAEFLFDNGLPMSELSQVDFATDFNDTDYSVLVYVPGPAGSRAARTLPNVVEIVIDEESSIGMDVSPFEGAPEYRLAPNQTMTLRDGAFVKNPRRRYYDTGKKAFRTVLYVDAIEDVGKAMSSQEFREQERAGVFQRDREGQFVSTFPRISDSGPAQEQAARVSSTNAPGRVKRVARVKRVTRTAPVARAGVERAGVQRAQAERGTSHRATSTRAQAARRRDVLAEAPSDALVLIEDDYTVLDYSTWARQAADDGAAVDSVTPWRTSTATRRVLAESGVVGSLDAEQTAMDNTRQSVLESLAGTRGPAMTELTAYLAIDEADLDEIAVALDNVFRSDAGYSSMDLIAQAAPNGKVSLRVAANRYATGPQNLVRWNGTRSTHSALSLVRERTGRLHDARTIRDQLEQTINAARQWPSGPVTDGLQNPWVNVWRAEIG